MNIRYFLGKNISKFQKPWLNLSLNMSTKAASPLDKTRKEMREIFLSGVDAVLPRTIIENQLKLSGNKLFVGDRSFPLGHNVYLVGFGKAVMNMVPGVEKLLGSRLKKGIISVPKGSKDTIWKVQDFQNFPNLNGPVEYREGAKDNQPDAESLSTTDDVIDLIEGLRETDTLIVLISGGGSALLCMPRPSIELKEKQEFCKKLQQAGADIRELNIVRKKLSIIKGGGLARMAYPASVISLILSDIVGDPIAEIASGPTVYSEKSPGEVTSILKKYELYDGLDWNMKSLLTSEEETENKSLLNEDKQFKHVHNVVIGNSSIAIEAAKLHALKKGFIPIVLRNDVEGDVSDVSSAYAKVVELICMALEGRMEGEKFFDLIKGDSILALGAEKIDEIYNLIENYAGQRVVLIGGGEPTVVVKGKGTGGRNQQLALHFSMDWLSKVKENPILSRYDVVMLSGGTDGQDGPTDAAGAFGYPAIGPTIHDLRKKLLVKLHQAMVEKISKRKAGDEMPGKSLEAESIGKEERRQSYSIANGEGREFNTGDSSIDEYDDPMALKLKALEKLIPENVIEDNDAYNFYSRFKKGEDLLKTGLTGTNVMDLHIVSIGKIECGCRIDFDMDSKCPDPLEEHYLDFDVERFRKHTTESETIMKEPKLLNLKVLDTSLTEICCSKAKKE